MTTTVNEVTFRATKSLAHMFGILIALAFLGGGIYQIVSNLHGKNNPAVVGGAAIVIVAGGAIIYCVMFMVNAKVILMANEVIVVDVLGGTDRIPYSEIDSVSEEFLPGAKSEMTYIKLLDGTRCGIGQMPKCTEIQKEIQARMVNILSGPSS